MAINITFADPEGFNDKEFEVDEALTTLQNLEEKDVYIDHAPVEISSITEETLTNANHIMIQDKLIGA